MTDSELLNELTDLMWDEGDDIKTYKHIAHTSRNPEKVQYAKDMILVIKFARKVIYRMQHCMRARMYRRGNLGKPDFIIRCIKSVESELKYNDYCRASEAKTEHLKHIRKFLQFILEEYDFDSNYFSR